MKFQFLDEVKSVQLASKIRIEDEKANEFCCQLDECLYDKHKDFVENALISNWLDEIDTKRASLQTPNFIEDL